MGTSEHNDLTLRRPLRVGGDNLRRFGAFELDTQTGELRKFGARIKLADQPFRILTALLEKPGELVTREQLRERIWPGETAGDFEQGLNRAVSKVRDALTDRAVNPRFIETLPGRGYRFIGDLQSEPKEAAVQASQPPEATRRRIAGLTLAGVVVLALCGGAARLLVPPSVSPLRWRKLTTDSYIKIPPALSDGTRVYFSASFGGEEFIAEVSSSGGHPVRLPITPPAPAFILHDLSPDRQEFLLGAAATDDRHHFMPLWTLRIADGSARRLGAILATSAAYSPSGTAIAYATPTEIWTAETDGSRPRRLIEVKESLVGSICWSVDGRRIRFSRTDPLSNYAVPWEINSDGSGLRSVLPALKGTSLIPAGWAGDGRMAIFFGSGSFWARSETWLNNGRTLEQVADNGPEFDAPIRIHDRSLFYAVGTDRLGEAQRYDATHGAWTPLLDGLSGEVVEYSPDGQHVAYLTYPQRTLWIRQADGKRPIQLTSQPLVAAYPRWSPDGKRIAFSAGEADGKPMRLYIADTDGGLLKPAVPSEPGSQGFSTWSPDGKSLLYGIMNTSLREDVYIRVANLETGKVTRFPGSEGLYGPRWSPDGRTIAALRFMGNRALMTIHAGDDRWQEASDHRIDWPTWMPDSRSILCKSGDHVVRYRLDTGKFETITTVTAEETGGYFRWLGVSSDGSPIRTLNRDSRQIYSLQLDDKQ